MQEPITTGTAGRITEFSTETMRKAIDRGEIPSIRASDGTRLVSKDDVIAWKQQKDAEKSARKKNGK